ncbi:MAG: hypothetical protein OCD00_14885 [Colwellia sp.]
MKKIRLIIITVLFCLPMMSQAQQALSKELIQSLEKVGVQLKQLETKYPKIFETIDAIGEGKQEEAIALVERSKAYPEIKAILNKFGFDSLEGFSDVSMRMMGSVMAYQKKNMPSGMDLGAMNQALSDNIQQMKDRNAPSSIITEMEKQLVETKSSLAQVKLAMKKATEADKKFVSDNIQWIMSVLDNDEN